VRERYGNLFDIYHEITNENAYKVPMRIFPAVHYTMGGLWVDYNLMSNVPGLFVLGEANFSDHGANRLGASALMQGLADGYFVLPYTIGDYLATQKPGSRPKADAPSSGRPRRTSRDHEPAPRRQGQGAREPLPQAPGPDPLAALRHGAQQGPAWKRPSRRSRRCARSSGTNVNVPGSGTRSTSRSSRGRVADFLELGELMCRDALAREESCGGHFREEHQYPDGECKRDDVNFAHVAAWEYAGRGQGAGAQHRAPQLRDGQDERPQLQVMSTTTFSVTVRVWRQAGPGQPGRFVEYPASGVNPDMSFLEMLDVLNDELTRRGEEPIAFAHDCREGICGTCSLVIDGKPHGPHHGVASCQTYMRSYKDGDVIVVEPFRARPFPVIKDLITDRSAFDKIQQAGGFISRTGSAPEANACRSRRRSRTSRWTPRSASGAAPAWPPARTRARCSSSRRRSPTWASCPRASPSATAACSRWSDHGRARLRRLHEPVRVQRGVPEADLARLHRPHEPRLREGDLPLGVQARGGRGVDAGPFGVPAWGPFAFFGN
jgi:hypothetical protein